LRRRSARRARPRAPGKEYNTLIDIKQIRETPDAVKTALGRRGLDPAVIDRIRGLDAERRAAITSSEELKARKNAVSKEIGAKKKRGEDAVAETEAMRGIGAEIEAADLRATTAGTGIETLLLDIPNLPDPAIPDRGNAVVAVHGKTPAGGEPHWEIATRLGLCDFERGVKLAQARFYLLTGLGARLERALIEFMLATALETGRYVEIMPPLLVNTESMKGTGQYPKFQEEYFSCERDGLALIPTAEVPVTNIHRNEILDELPLGYVAWTPCFRREAGSYGKDTRGLIRVHQFNKIELVRFEAPENAPAALEELTADAERVLERLELPYRKIVLAADDLGFASTKTYDLEVWAPGLGRYVECSSCSNFTDYQARRMMIRFRREKGAKPELVHTLNGSAIAVGRTWAALLENGLQPDGSVLLPPALRPFMGGKERIG
jgi:seryl-tRNA synthetase